MGGTVVSSTFPPSCWKNAKTFSNVFIVASTGTFCRGDKLSSVYESSHTCNVEKNKCGSKNVVYLQYVVGANHQNYILRKFWAAPLLQPLPQLPHCLAMYYKAQYLCLYCTNEQGIEWSQGIRIELFISLMLCYLTYIGERTGLSC